MTTPVVLEARHLGRRFGALAAVNDVSLVLGANRLHAVIGTNGAGKSTLVNLLSGELPATSGRVLLDGLDISSWSQPRRLSSVLKTMESSTSQPPSTQSVAEILTPIGRSAGKTCRHASKISRPNRIRFSRLPP